MYISDPINDIYSKSASVSDLNMASLSIRPVVHQGYKISGKPCTLKDLGPNCSAFPKKNFMRLSRIPVLLCQELKSTKTVIYWKCAVTYTYIVYMYLWIYNNFSMLYSWKVNSFICLVNPFPTKKGAGHYKNLQLALCAFKYVSTAKLKVS